MPLSARVAWPLVLLASVAGCSATTPTPSETPPQVSGAPSAPAPEPAPPDRTRCIGADVDLDVLLSRADCDVDGEAGPAPPREALIVYVKPAPLETPLGTPKRATLFYQNRAEAPLTLDLALGCGDTIAFLPALSASRFGPDVLPACDHPCPTRTVRVELVSGGIARKTISITPAESTGDAACAPPTGPSLSAGEHMLRVRTALADTSRVALGTLTVVDPNAPPDRPCSASDSNGPLEGGTSTQSGCNPGEYCECRAQAGYSCYGVCRPGGAQGRSAPRQGGTLQGRSQQ